MLSTVVTSSVNAAQIFALIAIIIFLVGAFLARPTWWGSLICVGLAFMSAALLWGLPG